MTVADLTSELKTTCGFLPSSYAEKLAESMTRRCQAIMDNNGVWTPYSYKASNNNKILNRLRFIA